MTLTPSREVRNMWTIRDESDGRIIGTYPDAASATAEAEAICRLAARSKLRRLVGVYGPKNAWAYCYRSTAALFGRDAQ